MFADDTKLFRTITKNEDFHFLQSDIDKFDEWSRWWHLNFNSDKCKVLTIGNRSLHALGRFKYRLGGSEIYVTNSERDLGVIMDEDLKFDSHVTDKANRANRILGLIRRTFIHLDAYNFVLLYKALVRPHLEFSNSVWSPFLVKHITMIENVQRRATKFLPGFKDLDYPTRLQKLNLPSLAYRRLRGDMIQVLHFQPAFMIATYLHCLDLVQAA